MLSSHPGTSVPKSLDSSPNAPNFKVKPRKKKPIIAITFYPLAFGEWRVTFFRHEETPKEFITYISPAQILIRVINDMRLMKFANVSPNLRGWTAYVDRAVYPPPKVSQGQPERDPFGVPYNDQTELESCPYCGSDDFGASWVDDLHKTSDDQPDHYDCANCGNSWEGA